MCCCVLEIRSISITFHNFTSVLLIHSQKAIKPVYNNKVNLKLEPAENRAKQQMVGVLDGVVMQCETEKNFDVGTSATPANNVTQTEKYCYKL